MVKQAAWVVMSLLRVARSEPVLHDELEHAHWDRDERRWITHSSST